MIAQPFTPRAYQTIARDFILEHERCNLWAVPGLGKTATIYTVLDILKLAGSGFFPALVIAPKKVCELTWPAEQKKWADFTDMRVIPILGERDARDAALLRRGDLYVINYENVQWLVGALKKRWPFRIVIADESTRLKNFRMGRGASGKRSLALSDIARQVGRWVNLTGTPSPNGLRDLWGQNWFVDFGARLGSTHEAFMQRWFYQNPYDRSVKPRDGAEVEIHAKIADVTLALRAEDWLDVHEPHHFTTVVELPPEARKLYTQMERELFARLRTGEIEAVNAGVASGKLLQMASGAVYDAQQIVHPLHDAKIEGLRSIVNELAGEPLLVAYWFKWERDMLSEAFPELRFFKTARDEADWNAGKIPIMAVHPASAGHGTNLQYGGRAMAHFTHTWDLELYQQVCERIGPVRQLQAGLNRAVLHYDIVAKDTLDEEVIDRRTSKRSVQDALMLARAHRGDE
ncbi:MAG: DEAD/DEAH box helicase [Rhizorhabdus sp.]|uniref:DEAD/DEAH box helicase n=1 Tax=Rhizorhabdus sp. TaxID=1968843 RepID=UPI001B6DD4D4|nr:DEAD/DEAH box helicase [Rhizorhabdus sp.]MBP8231772.1 DEAD/DEAH box helicase [Rhizorhabdus sp.]